MPTTTIENLRAQKYYEHQEKMAWIQYVQPVIEKNKQIKAVTIGVVAAIALYPIAKYLIKRIKRAF